LIEPRKKCKIHLKSEGVSMKRYEQFSHTADIGVRVYGRDMKELFENAAFAMFDIIADLENLSGDTVETFELEASDSEELLVAWLDELLYKFYTKQLIFYKFQVEELTENRLRAKAFARPVGANRNRLKTEIKAATYGGLKIKKSGEGCEVEIIFDV
jgi:SHS2 domain-containing protein